MRQVSTPSVARPDARVLGRMSNDKHNSSHGPDDEGTASGTSPVEQDAGEDITTDEDGTPVDNPSGG
ncbi:hypothetical protein GCM10027058_30890 [Microbacterium neimengense]